MAFVTRCVRLLLFVHAQEKPNLEDENCGRACLRRATRLHSTCMQHLSNQKVKVRRTFHPPEPLQTRLCLRRHEWRDLCGDCTLCHTRASMRCDDFGVLLSILQRAVSFCSPALNYHHLPCTANLCRAGMITILLENVICRTLLATNANVTPRASCRKYKYLLLSKRAAMVTWSCYHVHC